MASDQKHDHLDGTAPIVAVTGSGMDTASLRALLRRLPARPGAALVVVLQHRHALDEDGLRQAAQEGGHAPAELSDGAPVAPGRLYLAPAGAIVTVEDGRFRLRPAEAAGAHGVIDSFLVSLARDAGARSLVVALAGTDGDGTLGVREVKEAGGLALAEETPESRSGDLARSDGPAALADAVLPAEALADRATALLAQLAPGRGDALRAPEPSAEDREALRAIAAVLLNRTGHDFHGYKPGTFLRRVQRRMQALQVDSLPDYVEALRARPAEAQDLFNDLLIGVTEFFRDPREFELLERVVIPRLFEGRTARDQLRLWVVGCSTGEEAYSLAILLAEQRARAEDPPQIQIFASDLDGRALASARAGRYAGSIAERMPPERLARWFVREGDTYHVAKELREMCIFSQHSLIKDAPFSRIDLISCRNLLIYLDAELQAQVIPLFHFALRPGGFLFLGNSENASRHAELFEPVEPRSRIFRRLDSPARRLPEFPFTATDRRALASPGLPPRPERPRPDTVDVTRRAERIAERHAPAYVIIDEAHNVLHFSGRMGRFIDPARGAASLDLLQLVHPDLRGSLRAALARAAEEDRPVPLDGLSLARDGRHHVVDVAVEPIRDEPEGPASFVVLFKDAAARPGAAEATDPSADGGDHARRVEEELRTTKDRLQSTVEELESTNEELKSSNEEYQSLNEELQSANEELETSKEELQSVNEELTTVNGELAHRVQELGRANSDLKNFLEATQIATLFLDNDLRVTNFTPATAELFHLVEGDLGRPIAHIKARVPYEEIQDDARRVLRTLAVAEREIDDPASGARYIARVLPYRSTDNFIAGVVLTFTDIRARREAEERLRESEERFRAIVETAQDYAIFTTDAGGRIETWPKGAEQVFGWTPAEAIGRTMDITFTPEDREAGAPEEERRQARAQGHAPDVRWHLRKDGSRVFIEGITRPLSGPDGTVAGFVKVGQDMTERRSTEAALTQSEERFRQFGEASSDVLWIRDCASLTFEYVSPAFEEVYGLPREELLSGNHLRRWLALIHPEDRRLGLDHLRGVRAGESATNAFRVRRPSDGELRWVRDTVFPLRDAEGRVQRIAGIGHDATEEVEMHDRTRVLVAELQHRTRNLVAVISAVADKTLASSESLEDFQARFRARLDALGRVNGLLSRLEEGDRITFDTLIRTELSAHGVVDAEGQGSQVRLEGPSGGRLRSATVQTLALALHELTTNALKHGALSHPGGRLEIAWNIVLGRDNVPRLRVDWRETGMPRPPEAPDGAGGGRPRKGYGRRLIERALPYQLGADIDYELNPDGVRCTIVLPLSSTFGDRSPDPEGRHV